MAMIHREFFDQTVIVFSMLSLLHLITGLELAYFLINHIIYRVLFLCYEEHFEIFQKSQILS